MKYSWNWLCDYVDLSGIDPDSVAQRFTMTVAELEGVQKIGVGLDGVLVGQVVSCVPVEGSATLKAIQVDVGGRVVSGVSGAPNIAAGLKVPVALPGVTLPGGVLISQVTIHGIESGLMVASEKELGLSDDHSGVMELPVDSVAGARLVDALPIVDTVFEVDNKSITHRPDLWGHYGVAREVAAMMGRPLITLDEEFAQGTADLMSVSVQEPIDCPRYLGMCFDGVGIAPSPFWIRHRLRAVGLRPISNIVDLTNYIMMAVGEPMHAFDRRNITDDTIIVRRAAQGEAFRTLDGQDHVLTGEDLLIADSSRGVALAGVMGGENSEVLPDTSRLFIECATFHPGRIRRTSVRHSLRTDSSARFEKSLDPRAAAQAMAMFVKLLAEVCPGAAASSKAYDLFPNPPRTVTMRLDPAFVSRRLGRNVPSDQTLKILASLGFEIELRPDGIFLVTVPSWRATKDVSIPEDLLEEVGRFVGYDNIVPVHSKAVVSLVPRLEHRAFIFRSKHILASDCGLDEIERYSFDSRDTLKKIGFEPREALTLKNPISADHVTLRTHLAPNILGAMELNSKNFNDFQIFEVGRVFSAHHDDEGVPLQSWHIGILSYSRASRRRDQLEVLFRQTRGVIERFLSIHGFVAPAIDVSADDVDGEKLPWLHPGAALKIRVGGAVVGYVTVVHPAVMRGLDVLGGAVYVEFVLDDLMAAPRRPAGFTPIPRFPSSQIDLSLIIADRTCVSVVQDAIKSSGGPFLNGLELIDVYAGKPIPAGFRSVTFRLVFQASDRTLSDEEVKAAAEAITSSVRAAGARPWNEVVTADNPGPG